MIPLNHGIFLAVILFSLGLTSIFIRKNFLFMLIGLEIMLNAVAILFILAGNYWHQADGQIMFILVLSIAAAEASIGLSLLLKMYRINKTLNIDILNELQG